MKVNTDGCLLGAWAHTQNPKTIIDIGSGSGVIALMLAQRFNKAKVFGVEIDENCARQCSANFKKSPFSERLTTIAKNVKQIDTKTKYDLIVSNPPYFENDTPAKGQARQTARHHDNLRLGELVQVASSLVAPNGRFCVIIPASRFEEFDKHCTQSGFFLQEKLALKPLPNKPIHRYLLNYGLEKTIVKNQAIHIESQRGTYSNEVATWLKPFYLYL